MRSLLYGTKKAAEYLNVTQSTITQQCRAGRIAARKVGRDYVIEEGALNLYRELTQQLLSAKDGAATLPKVKSALAAVPISGVEFASGWFMIAFNWSPGDHLYSERGRLDATMAKREMETARKALARDVRAALVAAGLGHVKTTTQSPMAFTVFVTDPDAGE